MPNAAPILPSYEDLEAELAERDFYQFVKASWPVTHPTTDFVDSWHIGAMCEHLQAVKTGQIHNLLITVAPRSTKSVVASIDWPAWVWIDDPSFAFMFCSFNGKLASEHSVKCRNVIESPWYQRHWGDRFTLTSDQNEKMKFSNDHTGVRAAFGMGGATGQGADCVPGWIKVATNQGWIPISEIVSKQLPVTVLGSDGLYQEIEAYGDTGIKDIVEIETHSGRFQCSVDHPVWTEENGFIPAKDVIVSSSIRRLDDDFYLHSMCNAVQQGTKARGASKGRPVLFTKMLWRLGTWAKQSSLGRWESREKLRGLQRAVFCRSEQEGREVLFTEVQRTLAYQPETLAGMSLLCGNVSGRTQANGMFNELQESATRRADEKRQQQFSTRSVGATLYRRIYEEVKNGNHQAGLRNMLRMLKAQTQDRRSSYRRKQSKSFAPQSNFTLPFRSFKDSPRPAIGNQVAHTERVKAIRLLPSSRTYNLSLSGSHDFFADGYLTHNCVVVDDPHDTKDWTSRVKMKAAIDTYDSAIQNRVNNPADARRVIIMQCISEYDLAASVKKDGIYEHLMLPTEYDPKRSKVTSIGWKDPRTTPGQLLCPTRFGPEQVAQAKLKPRIYQAQHQQNPSSDVGAIFKRGNWRYYSEDPQDIVGKMEVVIQSWDLTFGQEDHGTSKVGGQVWGKIGANKFLLDRVLDYMDIVETLKQIRAMTKRWPQAKAKVVELKAAGGSVMRLLRDEIPGIISWPRKGEKMDSKIGRAYSVQPEQEGRNCCLPDPKIFTWVPEFVEYQNAFPEGEFDDDTDCFVQAMQYFDTLPTAAASAPQAVAKAVGWLR